MCKLLTCKLKGKVIWEAFLVALHRLKQTFGRNWIKIRKLLVGQNLFAANQKNEILNPLNWNQFSAFIHTGFELLTILKSQIVTSSFIFEMPNWHFKFAAVHFTFNSRWMPNFSMRLRSVARVMPSILAA